MSQNLRQRVLVNAVLDTRSTLAQSAIQNVTTILNPLIHVGGHPCPSRQANSEDFGNSEMSSAGDHLVAPPFIRRPHTARRYVFRPASTDGRTRRIAAILVASSLITKDIFFAFSLLMPQQATHPQSLLDVYDSKDQRGGS